MVVLLAAFFVILNILDVSTTNKILRQGGYEANPIVRFFMKVHLFIPFKVLTVICILLIMTASEEHAAVTLGLLCNGFYVLIVGSNFKTLHLQAKEMEQL